MQRDEEARVAALPQCEDKDTQTGSDQLLEHFRRQNDELTAEVASLQSQRDAQQEELNTISSENTYLQVPLALSLPLSSSTLTLLLR
jgi:hypothetical protein